MLETIAVIVVVLIAAVLVFAATRPDTFRIQRAARIKAPPEKIFPFINDLHRWGTWSPWAKKDPAMKRVHSGAASGKGAAYEWDGNRNIGKGRMEIMDTSPPSKLTIKLDFIKPFEAHNVVDFTLQPEGHFTKVTWAMQGRNNFMGKVMSLCFNMDRMVGKEFETGLANLKSLAEA